MLRKFLVALAAGALITSFSLATISTADAAKKKARAKAKVARVAPAPSAVSCVADILFLPITLVVKKRVC